MFANYLQMFAPSLHGKINISSYVWLIRLLRYDSKILWIHSIHVPAYFLLMSMSIFLPTLLLGGGDKKI